MKRLFYIVVALLLLFGGVFLLFKSGIDCCSFFRKSDQIILGGKTFSVEIADTDVLRAKGLGGHQPLGSNEGMLFVFERPDTHGFWMKDVTFPIDIIWIDENWRIIHIENSVTPDTYPKVFYPHFPAKYVLEIRAGRSEFLHILIDSHVEFIKKQP